MTIDVIMAWSTIHRVHDISLVLPLFVADSTYSHYAFGATKISEICPTHKYLEGALERRG